MAATGWGLRRVAAHPGLQFLEALPQSGHFLLEALALGHFLLEALALGRGAVRHGGHRPIYGTIEPPMNFWLA